MNAWMMGGLFISALFGGKSTHLACRFQDDRVPAIDVVVAPSYRAISLTIPSTGHVERRQATLSGAMLIFDSPLPYGNVNFSINRANLSVVRTEGGPSVGTTIATGQCEIEVAPKLIF
jgi:hypothetical protein